MIKNAMRIAMVGPFGFHPNKTMRSRALPIAKRLVNRGHTVRLFMPPWQTPEEAGKEWQDEGVDIRYTGLKGGYFGISKTLIGEIIAWRPELVHSFKPKAYSGIASWWLWNFKQDQIALVTDTDDWEGAGGWNDVAPYSALQKPFFAWQERWGMTHCLALTVASRALQSLAWAHGVERAKVHYLPNGPGIPTAADTDGHKRAQLGLLDRPVILVYSRLFEFDIGRLVMVMKTVKASVPDLAFLLIGLSLFEEDARHFREALAAADLEEDIVDIGWAEESELPQLIGAADVGIYLMDDTLLNRTKCPVKLADMLAMGIPVVAENVGQVSEYISHGESGLLRPAGDAEGVAQDLVKLLRDDGERLRLSTGAKERIRLYFNWETLTDTAEEAYAFALQAKKRS